MQRKSKRKSKIKICFEKKKKSMKKTKSRTFSCHTSQHFGKKKGNIIYFKINSVKSKRKKQEHQASNFCT